MVGNKQGSASRVTGGGVMIADKVTTGGGDLG